MIWLEALYPWFLLCGLAITGALATAEDYPLTGPGSKPAVVTGGITLGSIGIAAIIKAPDVLTVFAGGVWTALCLVGIVACWLAINEARKKGL